MVNHRDVAACFSTDAIELRHYGGHLRIVVFPGRVELVQHVEDAKLDTLMLDPLANVHNVFLPLDAERSPLLERIHEQSRQLMEIETASACKLLEPVHRHSRCILATDDSDSHFGWRLHSHPRQP